MCQFITPVIIILFAQNLTAQTSNSFLLNVDFSQTSFNVQPGFQGYLAEHENNNSFLKQSYEVNESTVSIDVKWPDGTPKEAKQMISRGINSATDSSDLLRDWIGTDGRVAKVPLKFTIAGLPAGLYEWKSFHHDNNDQTGIFKVLIEDAGGASMKRGIDISNGNLAFENVTVFETLLKSDGSDIILSFEMEAYPDNSTSFFLMNGFSLNEINTTLPPEMVNLISPLNQLQFLSENTELKWTNSYYADMYRIYLGTENPPPFLDTTENTSFITSSLMENTTYYWHIEAVNNNGSAKSDIWSFTTQEANGDENIGELEVDFSHDRKYYEQPFELTLTSTGQSSNIIYTVDCSTPSVGHGMIYNESLLIDTTTIIKAIAVSATGNSRVYTKSFLFTSSLAKQGKQPKGFPATWGGSSVIDADYEMDPEVINAPEYASKISDAFKSLPSLCLSMDVEDWFNPAGGLYVGYPNSNETREKPVTAEFIFSDDEESFSIECGVQNQGGTSIVNWKIPKQSMRLLFKEIYGPGKLNYKLFPDSKIESINTLVIDGLLYSWIHPWDEKQHVTSLYFRDQLASDMQNNMDWLSFHGRYVHLYLNGLYWGIYDLHERPDDAFLAEYMNADREDFDIIKHNPNRIVQGSNRFYLEMLQRARLGLQTEKGLKDIQKYLDLPAFIDYMLLNFYMGNFDWDHQNYYAARNKTFQTGFRFYTWDAEHVMRYSDVNYNNTLKFNEGGPTEIHTFLKENEEYRMMFADAVYKHCFNDGVFTPESFEKSFLRRATEIQDAIILESARWGDFRAPELNVTYTKNDHWIPEVEKVLKSYIPNRREIFIEQLRDFENRLFPDCMPPVFEVEELSSRAKNVSLVHTNLVSGDVYFTVDGTDPRANGGGINGIRFSGKISLENTTIMKARFYDKTKGTWSALAEKLFLFDEVYGENLVINEIMYHPEETYPEFIEIMNNGESLVDVKAFTLSDGIEYTFGSNMIIQPGAGVVLSNDTVLFKNTYHFNAAGQYQKKLSNKGENIVLRNSYNQLIDSVAYMDEAPWPELADGYGYSIELIDAAEDNALGSNWAASEIIFGTPFHQETHLELESTLYPNPFNNIAFITFSDKNISLDNVYIEVYNQLGSKVKTIDTNSYNSLIEIDLSGVAPGLYVFKVQPANNATFSDSILKAVKLR